MRDAQKLSVKTGFVDPTQREIERMILIEYQKILDGRPTKIW